MQPRQGSPGTTRGDTMGAIEMRVDHQVRKLRSLCLLMTRRCQSQKSLSFHPTNPARLELMSILTSLVSGENTALAHSYPVRGSLKPQPVPAGDSHGAPSSTQEA